MKIRNWMRLSLRDLFWATALVAVGLGWYLDHWRVADVNNFLTGLDSMASYDPPRGFFTFLVRRDHAYRISCDPVVDLQSNYNSEEPPDSTEYPHTE